MLAAMGLVSRLLAVAPEDPLLLAGAVILVWLPICALVLGSLALLAALQRRLGWRRQPRASMAAPPAAVLPLAGRQVMTVPPRAFAPLSVARLVLAVGIVLGLTTLILISSGSVIVAALRS